MKGNWFKMILALFAIVFIANSYAAISEKANEKTSVVITNEANIDLCVDADVQTLIITEVSVYDGQKELSGFLYDREIKLDINNPYLFKNYLHCNSHDKYCYALTNNDYYNNNKSKFLEKENGLPKNINNRKHVGKLVKYSIYT